MPRAKAKAVTAEKLSKPEKLNVSDERVDFDGDNDNEEMTDEEVEYEEVEEEEEVEEIEEGGEEDEEEEEEEEDNDEEEEEEEEEEEANVANGADTRVEDGEEREKHAKLLALPPHGSEVYIGGIPLDASEEDLKGFCEVIGEVKEVRILKGLYYSNENKGFAFVSFRSVELAAKAIDRLNNTEFKGKRIKCSTSSAKNRLFIGNVPRSWGDEDLRKTVTAIGPGVTAVEVVKDMKISNNNRGFGFIDFYNHACADYSRQKMMNPKFKLGDNAPTVSWAEPKSSDSSTSQQVKAVFVKNLPKDITEDQLRKLFEHHGKITEVILPPAMSGQGKYKIGFVHFAERSSAMKALKNTEKYELNGQQLDCSLAKPQAKQKSGGGSNSQKSGGGSNSQKSGGGLNSQNSGLLSSYPPHSGYGLVGGAYGTPGFAQPLIYGTGHNPAGMAMMPMLLPDGRIAYVLQQPGVIQHTPPSQQRGGSRSGTENGGSSSRGRHGNDSGRRYRPY